MEPDRPHDALDTLLRDEGRRVLATLARVLGSLEVAEDAVQEAGVEALRTWGRDGVPDDPRAWLTVVARNRARDRLRAEGRADARQLAAVAGEEDHVDGPEQDQRDDLLRLLFTCCHPALSMDARVALALRTLCGLSTHQVSAALLLPEPTLAKRLVRARRKIADAGIPYRVPEDHELPQRLPAVVQVVRLVFTEGHRATEGDALVRLDLCREALHLADLLVELFPDEGEVLGLWALLTATHARRVTRTDGGGDLVLLADQDRSRWDHEAIDRARQVAERAWARAADHPGPVLVEAAIAVLHATAPSHAATDWPGVVELYGLLEAATGNPVVRWNRAVALAEVAGPAAGLALLDDARARAPGHLRDAARADLLLRLGRRGEAADAYRAALAHDPPAPERRFLRRRLATLEA